jgi:hypothetical protein
MHLKKRDSESRLSAVLECIGSQSAALVSESAYYRRFLHFWLCRKLPKAPTRR